MSGPDAEAVVEQLLLTYHGARKMRFLRRRRVGSGGVAMLRSAGMDKSRAEAINTMARRTADAWRNEKMRPTEEDVAAEVMRLLA